MKFDVITKSATAFGVENSFGSLPQVQAPGAKVCDLFEVGL